MGEEESLGFLAAENGDKYINKMVDASDILAARKNAIVVAVEVQSSEILVSEFVRSYSRQDI